MTDGRLGEETVGELISQARRRQGKSQYAGAASDLPAQRRCSGPGMVARWETGRRIPTPYWRVHLAAVLHLPPTLLDRAAAAARARRAGAGERQPASSAERLRYVLAHPDRADLVSVAHLREQVWRLDERYDRLPSTALIPETGQYLGQVVFLTAHARRSQVRRELHAAEAETATLMGQLVWDASQRRDHDTADAYFDQAADAAHHRGDTAAEALALLRKSFVALYGRHEPGWPLPSTRRARPPAQARFSVQERREANRAIAVSAIGLAATGIIELLLAIVTGSVGLLGDAIHNLSDVSTSAVVFIGFRVS